MSPSALATGAGGAGSSRSGRVGRAAVGWPLVVVVALAASCGVGGNRGVELGHLRGLARRVEGGGVECPLAIPAGMIRPSTVEHDVPVLPLRIGGAAAEGFVGTAGPTDGVVRITCRYQAGDVSITLAVVGVPRGHAVAEFADRLAKRGDGAVVLTFIDVNADLPVGRARALPGDPPAVFTRVAAADGDVALVLSVDDLEPTAELPGIDEVERAAVTIAESLSR